MWNCLVVHGITKFRTDFWCRLYTVHDARITAMWLSDRARYALGIWDESSFDKVWCRGVKDRVRSAAMWHRGRDGSHLDKVAGINDTRCGNAATTHQACLWWGYSWLRSSSARLSLPNFSSAAAFVMWERRRPFKNIQNTVTLASICYCSTRLMWTILSSRNQTPESVSSVQLHSRGRAHKQ